MTGSLQTKKNRPYWYMVIDVVENGKRKQQWISTKLPIKGNKRKAEKMLENFHATVKDVNDNTSKANTLFVDLIREWLESIENRVEATTYEKYVAVVDSQIIPYFDKLQIMVKDITEKTIQCYINEKFKNGRIDNKGGLSAKTLRHHRNIISQVLDVAVRRTLLLSNPCKFVNMPKKQRYDYKFYTKEQINKMLLLMNAEEIFPVIKTTVSFGLRRSECLGIKWNSIDFENERLVIRSTVVSLKGQSFVERKSTTKNVTSHRSFHIPLMLEMFKRLQEEQLQNERDFGRCYNKNDYVFKRVDGSPYTPDYVTAQFANLLMKHNLPHIRFHDLRHSFASALIDLNYGIKDIQELLGHSSITQTADTYSHLESSRKAKILDDVSNAIG